MTTLRAANQDDAAALATLHTQDRGRAWSGDEFATFLGTPGIYSLVASASSSQTCGFVLVRQVGPEAEVMALVVDAAARRQGVGRQLMQAATNLLAKKGVRSLFLEVAQDNDPAIQLYGALGFARIGKRRNYYARANGSAVDANVLQLDLRGPDAADPN